MRFSRRDFIKSLVGAGMCAGLLSGDAISSLSEAQLLTSIPAATGAPPTDEHIFYVKEALFYEKMKEDEIKCKLCPKECEVGDRERGWCGVRENREGIYYTLVYGNPCSIRPDPIEKKPLFHFLPGTWAFSLATAGCNLNCKFCQNWNISQVRPEETKNIRLPPADVVAAAKENNRCRSIAYTYSEPTVFYEYMLDTAKLGREADLKSVVISAGYINPDPLKQLCEHVDAVKIDLKSLRDKYYKDICSAELKPVLDALKILRDSGVWYELVYLVVTSLNDSDEELRDTARWVYDNLGPDVPLHFSRFYPTYQLYNLGATDPERLTTAREMAMDIGLNYAYIGNVPGDPGENTYCPKCGETLIKRERYFIRQNNMINGACKCGEKIPGVWDSDV